MRILPIRTKNVRTDLRPAPSGQVSDASSRECGFEKLEINPHVAGLGLDWQVHGVQSLKMRGKCLRQVAGSGQGWVHRKPFFLGYTGAGKDLSTIYCMEATDKCAIWIAEEV